MLKFAMYFNVFLLFVMSIIFLIRIFVKKDGYEELRQIIILYIAYDILSFNLCSFNIVEVGLDLLFIFPIFLLSLIMLVIGLFCVSGKNNRTINFNSDNYNSYTQASKKCIIVYVLPFLVFIIPYIYELYIINNCDYLLYYNSQSGIIVSEDSYIAVINHRPLSVTLQKNLFNREGKFIELSTYDIRYNDDIQITYRDYKHDKVEIKDEKIRKVALDVKERCKSAQSMELSYFSNRKYAIATALSDTYGGTVLDEFLYYNNRYIQRIKAYGGLESVTYYK